MLKCEFVVFGKLPYILIGVIYRVERCVNSSFVAVFTVGCVMVLV